MKLLKAFLKHVKLFCTPILRRIHAKEKEDTDRESTGNFNLIRICVIVAERIFWMFLYWVHLVLIRSIFYDSQDMHYLDEPVWCQVHI